MNPLMKTATLPLLSIDAKKPLLKVHWLPQPLPKLAIICLPAKESNLGQTEVFTTISLDSQSMFPQTKSLNFHMFARNTIDSLGKFLCLIMMAFFATQI